MCQAKTAERTPDRHTMDPHLVCLGDLQHQIIECQIRLRVHPTLDPVAQTSELAMSASIALGTRLQPACLAFQDHHVIHELHRNPKPRRRGPMRMIFFNERDNTFAKLYRKWFAHLIPPYLTYRQGITDQPSRES